MNFIKKKIKTHKKPHESDDDLYASTVNRPQREEGAGEKFEVKQDTEEWQFFQQLTQRVQDTVSKTQTVLTKLKDTSAVSELDKPDYYLEEEEEVAKPLPPTVKTWIQFSEDGDQPLEFAENDAEQPTEKDAKAPPRPPPPKSVTPSDATKPAAEESADESSALKEEASEEPAPDVGTSEVDQTNVLSLLEDFTYKPEPASVVNLDVSGLLDVDEGGPDPFDTSFVEEKVILKSTAAAETESKSEASAALLFTDEKISTSADHGSPDPFDTSFIDTGALTSFSTAQEPNNNEWEGLDFLGGDSVDKRDSITKVSAADSLLETFPSISKSDTASAESKVCDTAASLPDMSNPFLTDTAVSSSDFTTDFFGISSGREHDGSTVLPKKTGTNPFEDVDTITSSVEDMDLLGASFQGDTAGSVSFSSTSPFKTDQQPTSVFDLFGSPFDQKPTEVQNGDVKPLATSDMPESIDNDPFEICSQPSSRRESSVRKESLPEKPFDAFPLQTCDSKRSSIVDGIQLSTADSAKPDAFSDPFDSFSSFSEKRISVGSVKLPPVSEAETDLFDLISKPEDTVPASETGSIPNSFEASASVLSPPKQPPPSGGFSEFDDIFGAPVTSTAESSEPIRKESFPLEDDSRRDSTKSNAELLDDIFGSAPVDTEVSQPLPATSVETSVASTIQDITTSMAEDTKTADNFDPFFDIPQETKKIEPATLDAPRKPSLASLNPFEISTGEVAEQEPAPLEDVEKAEPQLEQSESILDAETKSADLISDDADQVVPESTSADLFEPPKTEDGDFDPFNVSVEATTIAATSDSAQPKVSESAFLDPFSVSIETTTTTTASDSAQPKVSESTAFLDPFSVSVETTTTTTASDSAQPKVSESTAFLDFGVFDTTPATKNGEDFGDPFISGSTTFEPAKSSVQFTDTAAFEAFAAKFEQAIEKLDDGAADPLQSLDPFGGVELSDTKVESSDSKGFDTMDIFDPFAPVARPPENTPTKLPQKAPSQDSFDDDEGPDFSITIRPKMRDTSATPQPDLGPPPLLPPPPKSPTPQVPASRFNPFNKDFGFPAEEVAQEEPTVAEPIVAAPFESEPPPALGEAATKRTESQESPSTPLFDEDTSQPLEEFPPKFEGDGWEMMLRQPNKKKITGNRFWKKVYIKVSENSVLQLFNKKEDNDPFQELPLQACYSLSEIGAQQYDQYGKIFTVKLQYVFYRERVGVRPAQISKVMQGHITSVGQFAKLGLPLEHAPQVSQLLKIGTLSYPDMKTFVQVVEDALFHLTVHRDRALTYKTEEVQVFVHDELYVEQNKMGHITKQQARVRIFFLAFITGMPDVEVGINDLVRQGKEVVGRHDIIPVVTEEWIRLENCEFHSCVVQEEFEKNRIVKLHPPDACFFELMRFRIRPPRNRELPLQIKAVMKIVKTKVEIRIDVLVPGYHSRKHGQVPCEDVQIRFPMPECWIYLFRVEKHSRYGSLKSAARKPGKIMGLDRIMGTAQHIDTSLIEVSAGQAKYEHAFRAVVWRVPRLPKEGHGAYTTQLLLVRLDLTSFDQIPSTFSQYVDVEFSMPATTVSHTTIRSVSVTNQNPPEKYVRYVAKHEYKVEIDFCFESEESEYVAAATAAAAAAQVSSPPPSERQIAEEDDDSD